MRKVILTLLASAFVVAIAAPALADEGAPRLISSSQGAWASWSFREPLSPTSWRETDTYVSVYRFGNETYANLSRGLLTCTETTDPQPTPIDGRSKPTPKGGYGYDCTGTWAGGDVELPRGAFSMDALQFTKAHLAVTIPLQSYDAEGNPTGAAVPTTVDADWTGTGTVQRTNGHSSYCDASSCFVDVFTYSYRSAVANASIDKAPLGQSADASLSGDHTIAIGIA